MEEHEDIKGRIEGLSTDGAGYSCTSPGHGESAQTKFTSAIMQELHNAAGAKQAGKCMQPVSIIILYDTSETRQ